MYAVAPGTASQLTVISPAPVARAVTDAGAFLVAAVVTMGTTSLNATRTGSPDFGSRPPRREQRCGVSGSFTITVENNRIGGAAASFAATLGAPTVPITLSGRAPTLHETVYDVGPGV